LPIKLGLELGKCIINKYYNLTDESEIYCVSIGNFSSFQCFSVITNIFNIVLHPSLKARYFKANKWPQEWQDEAIKITRRIFDEDYKDFGMVKDRSTSSVNISQVQRNEVSETNIFISLLTLHREICSVQQCTSRWGGLEVLGLVMCVINSTSGWRNLWYRLKIHFIGGLQIRICTLVFLKWQSMSMQCLVSSCISFSSATTHNVLATAVDVERSFSCGRILRNRLRASSI